MSFLSRIFTKSYDTSVIRKLCEFVNLPLGSTYTDRNSVEQYRGWVYIAAKHNATNIADGEISLYTNKKPSAAMAKPINQKTLKEIKSYGMKSSKETMEIETHPILTLLQQPNPNTSLYDFLFEIELYLEITGDAYVSIERVGNIPVALNILEAQYVTIQTDGRNQLIGYNYSGAGGLKQFTPDEIIHFKFFDVKDPHYGISPLQACAASYGLINAMDIYEQSLSKNSGTPSGVLKYKTQSIKESDRQIIENKWSDKFAGVGRAGKTIVTDQDVEYQPFGLSPKDMAMLEGRKWAREEILGCFGVNPAMLLNTDVNRSNMITASINYYHNTLKPRFKLISQTLSRELINKNGIDGKDMFIVINKDAPQDSELILQEMTLLTNNAAISINELRNSFGFEEIDGGDEMILNNNEVINV